MGDLIDTYRNSVSLVHNDICRLENRIAEKAKG